MPTLRTQGQQHRKLIGNLRKLGMHELADRVHNCGRVRIFRCNECDECAARVVMRCKYRLCPYCASLNAHIRAKGKEGLLRDMEHPYFITLSMPKLPVLADAKQIQSIAWGKFSRLKEWERTWAGGMVSVEVAYSPKGWHVHMHIVADMIRPCDPELLAAMWEQSSPAPGTQFHMRAIDNLAANANEVLYKVARYSGKPPGIHNNSFLVKEWHDTMVSARLHWAFGNCRAHPAANETPEGEAIDPDIPNDAPIKPLEYCPHCGTHDTMQPDRTTRTGSYKYWARYRAKPMGYGWYSRPPPEKVKRGAHSS